MNLGRTPDTEAFQDEFTRVFMASTKEVEEGYYLFESRTGGYTMLWPVNTTNDKMFYERHGEYFESMHFGESNEEENIGFFIRSIYDNGKSTEKIEINLKLLSESVSYEGDYQREDTKKTNIYYAELEKHITEAENGFFYVFLAYVKSKNSPQAISINYSSRCKKEDIKCELDKDKEREKAKKIMKSIEFKY